MKLKLMALLAGLLLLLGVTIVGSTAIAAPPISVVTWQSKADSGLISVKEAVEHGVRMPAQLTLATTYCRYASHTQYAQDFPSYQILGWHKVTLYFCYNGSAVIGTPYVTYHDADSTAYGTSVGISFYPTGVAGPYQLSSYQWSATAYATYKQCIGWPVAVCRSQSRYIIITPQGSGSFGWQVG